MTAHISTRLQIPTKQPSTTSLMHGGGTGGRPWLLIAMGTAAILTAGPIGEVPIFARNMWTFIFSWSGGREIGRDDYCLILGLMALGTGCCVTSVGVTGFRPVPAGKSWLYRLVGRLRWSPAIAAFLLAVLLLLAHKPSTSGHLFVEVAAPEEYRVKLNAVGVRYTDSQPYRESWDFLLGLASGPNDEVFLKSAGLTKSEFVIALPRWTLRNWHPEWRSVTLEGDSPSDSVIVNMDPLGGVEDTGGKLFVDISSVRQCEPHGPRRRCFALTSETFSVRPDLEVHVNLTSILTGSATEPRRR